MEFPLLPDTQPKVSAKKIRSAYERCLDDVAKNFSLQDNNGEVAVHNLRVDLKRVNALIALISFNNHSFPQKKINAFKALFSVAGKLRAIQVEFNVINKYFNNDSFNTNYLHQLHEQKAKRLKAYRKFLDSGIPRSLKEGIKLMKKKVSLLTKKQIIHYLSAEQKNLAKQLKRNIFREQKLHVTRKGLKRYYLNLKMAGRKNERVERMLDLLGSWHDHQIAFDHVVKTIYTGQLTEPESEPIRNIKQQLINDKELLYEKTVSYYVANGQNGRS